MRCPEPPTSTSRCYRSSLCQSAPFNLKRLGSPCLRHSSRCRSRALSARSRPRLFSPQLRSLRLWPILWPRIQLLIISSRWAHLGVLVFGGHRWLSFWSTKATVPVGGLGPQCSQTSMINSRSSPIESVRSDLKFNPFNQSSKIVLGTRTGASAVIIPCLCSVDWVSRYCLHEVRLARPLCS